MEGRLFLSRMFLLPFMSSVVCQPYKNYSDLYKSLFSNYNVNLRPVNDGETAINVSVGFVMLSIQEISERDQTMMTNGWLILQWTDEMLSWNGSETGVPSFVLQQDTIWRPDIAIKNVAKETVKLENGEHPVRLFPNGSVIWFLGTVFHTTCEHSVKYFPFDVQSCDINLFLWLSTSDEVMLTHESIYFLSYIPNGLWEIVSWATSATSRLIKDLYPDVLFTLVLRRRRLFYVINTIVPVLILSCMTPLVFVLDPDCGEKMGFSMTVLLAYTVFLANLGDMMPQTSIEASILSIYLAFMVVINAVSVCLSALILKLNHKPETSPPSRNLQRIIRTLRGLLCLGVDINSKRQVTPASPDHDVIELSPGEQLKVTWKMTSETLDCLCFILLSLVTVLISVPALTIMAVQEAV